MLSARFTSFLLFFILLTLTFSSAHSQHQVKKRLVVASGSKLEIARSSVNVEKIYHGVPAVGETDTRLWFLRTRKMMSKVVVSKSKVVESEDRNGKIAKGSTTKGKARCMIGKCDNVEGQGISNMKHKFSKSSGRYEKVKVSGSVPLTADYYYPRSHPPKNN